MGTGVSATILYWIGRYSKATHMLSSVAVVHEKGLVPEEVQIEVSSRYRQGIISYINCSNWLNWATLSLVMISCVRSQAFAVVETSAEGVSICLDSRCRLGDGKS